MSSDFKVKVQGFGRFLSSMVMPNIGAFIAWGAITAMFIPTGWLPNPMLAQLVAPMITYLLPLLIGYTGGRLAGGERGAVVGAITTMGVIAGADMPMFMGAMIAGPLGGYAIKRFDKLIDGKIKSGFEMLVNNFSAGIIGMLLAILAFLAISPAIEFLSKGLASGLNYIVAHDALPLAALLVEPAKILFLNNAVDHGIFSPLGIQQSHEVGRSIFFLIVTNPGPGLGLLLAYMFFGRGDAKNSSSGAVIIHFFGGIHEIYFPYVLMKPKLIFAVIIGGMVGLLTFSMMGAGLVSPASPGSIIALLAMTPKGYYVATLSGIATATVTSFLISAAILKMDKVKVADDVAQGNLTANGQQTFSYQSVGKIIVACDAGMGSSAMGASVLRKMIQEAGLSTISVSNMAINHLPPDADIVITHRDLTARARHQAPDSQHLSLHSFLDKAFYKQLVERLQAEHAADKAKTHSAPEVLDAEEPLFTLTQDNIFLGQKALDKTAAIRFAGEQLVAGGYIETPYIAAMLKREAMTSTYLGESIAVPHGTIEAKDQVLKTGIVFCQYPEGVRFGDEEEDIAHLVIGIAARNDEHMQVLTQLTNILDDDALISLLKTTTDPQRVVDAFDSTPRRQPDINLTTPLTV